MIHFQPPGTVVSETPFMGLVPQDTTSWREPEYSMANVNTCWELCIPISFSPQPSRSSVGLQLTRSGPVSAQTA